MQGDDSESHTWWFTRLTFQILLQYVQDTVAEKLPKEFIKNHPLPDNDSEGWSENNFVKTPFQSERQAYNKD